MADAMDSKSISREGVGVRVPALAPPAIARAAERLARAYVPAIVARLRALGEAYEALAERLARASAAELAWDPALESDEAQAGALGYALGVLAAAAGSPVLRARRMEAAPRVLVELVLERHAVVLDPAPIELPRAAPAGGAGWEATFALALLFDAAAARAPGARLAWSCARVERGWRLRFAGAPTALAPEAEAALAALGVEARAAGEHVLPAAWLLAPGDAPCAPPG